MRDQCRKYVGTLPGRRVGAADLPNFFRTPFGPGSALGGNAGYHKDPITAQGITDALRDAELLAAALDQAPGRARLARHALADYQRARDEAARPMYEHTFRLAALEPPTRELLALFEALRGDQDQTDRFLGTIDGTPLIYGFFSKDNLQRTIGGAPSRPPRTPRRPVLRRGPGSHRRADAPYRKADIMANTGTILIEARS